MSTINITLDVSKINKDKIVDRTFKKADGIEVKTKDYKIEVVELIAPKFIKEGESWRLLKTHFVAEAQTKEEKANKVPVNFIGDGFTFEDKTTKPVTASKPVEPSVDYPDENINVDDIPF